MELELEKVNHALKVIKTFLDKYSALGDAHMVEYFSKDHWNNFLGEEVRKDLMKFSIEELYLLPLHDLTPSEQSEKCPSIKKQQTVEDLNHFLKEARRCHLDAFDILTDKNDIMNFLQSEMSCLKQRNDVDIRSKEYMCKKKSHEVTSMSPIVDALCQFCGTSEVLDVGSGKGYLSAYLSLQYGLSVTGVDSNESNTLGADARAKKYFDYWSKHLNSKVAAPLQAKNFKFSPVTAVVKNASDLNTSKSDSTCVITGLHACGDLTSNIVSIFAKQPEVVGLCVVGCCYHLLTEDSNEEDEIGFPMSECLKGSFTSLGRNKRMLGLKAPQRVASLNTTTACERSDRSLFYRAILTMILKEEFGVDVSRDDITVGKVFGKSKDFVDYVRRCIKKLKLDNSLITDGNILKYFHSYEDKFKEIVAFSMIRQIYAPAIESLIILDKFCFLLENLTKYKIKNCFLSEIFDPIKSPRRWAIIAVK